MSACIEVSTGRSKGYGSSYIRVAEGKRFHVLAHRFVFEQERGPIPAGMQVCHACDNPPCINIEHLFLGTNKDNVRDAMAKGRRRRHQCRHDWQEIGVVCPGCNRDKARAWYQALTVSHLSSRKETG